MEKKKSPRTAKKKNFFRPQYFLTAEKNIRENGLRQKKKPAIICGRHELCWASYVCKKSSEALYIVRIICMLGRRSYLSFVFTFVPIPWRQRSYIYTSPDLTGEQRAKRQASAFKDLLAGHGWINKTNKQTHVRVRIHSTRNEKSKKTKMSKGKTGRRWEWPSSTGTCMLGRTYPASVGWSSSKKDKKRRTESNATSTSS